MAVVTREFLAQDAALGARELIDYCYDQGWTDGLPVVPPLQEFVDEWGQDRVLLVVMLLRAVAGVPGVGY